MSKPVRLLESPAAAAPPALLMTRSTCMLCATALAAFFVFSNLALRPLEDWDEAWHARVALDMARQNRFLTYLEGDRLTTAALKPPLYLWAMALSFKALGPSEFAARLFPALCHVGLVAGVAAFCLRRFNWTVALVAAFLLSTCPLLVYKHGGRAADIDAPLVLFLTLTMFGVYRLRTGAAPWWLPVVWACAVLIKGPAALQIVPVVLVWLSVMRAWRALWLAVVFLLAGLLPMAVFLIAREHFQPGVIAASLGREAFSRISSEIDGDPRQWWDYFRVASRASWPVLAGLAVALAAARARPGLSQQAAQGAEWRDLLALLLLWWLIPLAIFTTAQTKRDWYIYPSLVPAYILAAWILRAALAKLEQGGRPHSGPLVALIVIAGYGVPAFWHSVVPSQTHLARLDEYSRLVTSVEQTGSDAVLIGFWLMPGEKFYLTRAGLPILEVEQPDALPAAVAHVPGRKLLLYRNVHTALVAGLLPQFGRIPLCTMPRRGNSLVELRTTAR